MRNKGDLRWLFWFFRAHKWKCPYCGRKVHNDFAVFRCTKHMDVRDRVLSGQFWKEEEIV